MSAEIPRCPTCGQIDEEKLFEQQRAKSAEMWARIRERTQTEGWEEPQYIARDSGRFVGYRCDECGGLFPVIGFSEDRPPRAMCGRCQMRTLGVEGWPE